MLTASTSNAMQSSSAASTSLKEAPPEALNTFIFRICASGATPMTASRTPSFPAAVAATWVPCSPSEAGGAPSLSLSP